MAEGMILSLIKLIGPLLIAAGYVRGRLNGMVRQVDRLERVVDKMETRYAECKARIRAEAHEADKAGETLGSSGAAAGHPHPEA